MLYATAMVDVQDAEPEAREEERRVVVVVVAGRSDGSRTGGGSGGVSWVSCDAWRGRGERSEAGEDDERTEMGRGVKEKAMSWEGRERGGASGIVFCGGGWWWWWCTCFCMEVAEKNECRDHDEERTAEETTEGPEREIRTTALPPPIKRVRRCERREEEQEDEDGEEEEAAEEEEGIGNGMPFPIRCSVARDADGRSGGEGPRLDTGGRRGSKNEEAEAEDTTRGGGGGDDGAIQKGYDEGSEGGKESAVGGGTGGEEKKNTEELVGAGKTVEEAMSMEEGRTLLVSTTVLDSPTA